MFVAFTLCLLTACGQEEAPRLVAVTQQAAQAEERAQKEQKAREVAENQRQEAEKARQVAEESKSNWQTLTGVLGILAIVLLMFGIALGSSARKDAAARKPPNE